MKLLVYCTNMSCKERFKEKLVEKDEALRLKYKKPCDSCSQDLYFLDKPLL